MNKVPGFKKLKYLSAILSFFLVLAVPANSHQNDQGTKFDAHINISKNSTMIETEPAIAVDKNNTVHIAWTGFYVRTDAPDGVVSDIFYSNNKKGKFSKPKKIRVSEKWYSRSPTITVDSKGNAHIAFRRSENQTNLLSEDDIYYATNAKNNFKKPVLVVDGIFGFPKKNEVSAPYLPLIHCDSQDHICLTFLAWGFGSMFTDYYILFVINEAGDWSDPQLAAQGNFVTDYQSILDQDDKLHFVFDDIAKGNNYGVFYTNNRNGEFFKPVKASAEKHTLINSPGIAVDSLGKAHIIYEYWGGSPGDPEIYYTNNANGEFNTWTPMQDSWVCYIPSIAVDAFDFIHIIYKRNPAYGGPLFYANNFNGEFEVLKHDMTGNEWWYPGSCLFAMGNSPTLHISFYDFMDQSYDSDTEIFYLKGTCDTPAVPNPPKTLRAKPLLKDKIKLKWKDKSKDEDGFEIQRRKKENGTWICIFKTKANAKSYVDEDPESKISYQYRVRAFNSIGNSLYSNTAETKTRR